MSDSYIATVQTVVREGPHGPYVIATCSAIHEGSLTISLQSPVWKESEWPDEGTEVIVQDLRKKRQGWRAHIARFVRPGDEQQANSNQQRNQGMSSPKLDEILQPLENFRVRFTNNGRIHLLNDEQPGQQEMMSHAEFLRQQVLPVDLKDICKLEGIERVAWELVSATLPFYDVLGMDVMSLFWQVTVRGHESDSPHKEKRLLNPAIAEKLGVSYLYRSILQLAQVHKETDVFGVRKFLVTHACGMGGPCSTGMIGDLESYIELSGRLLRSGTYDWSIMLTDANWQLLDPIARKFGIRPILEPVVDIMTGFLQDKPCTRDPKYHESGLRISFNQLVPVLVAAALAADSTDPIRSIMGKIGKMLESLHTFGAFRHDSQHRCTFEFFKNFAPTLIARSLDVGLDAAIAETCRHWAPRLLPPDSAAA